MTGFFATLTLEQQQAALAYRGPENHGPVRPALSLTTTEPDMGELHALLKRIEGADGPDLGIEMDLRKLEPEPYEGMMPRHYTAELEAATGLISRVLPNWFWTCGLCNLTGHASIGADYNGPARERLFREFPVERFDEGFHADLAPGDGIHRVCYALLSCMVQALIAVEDARAPAPIVTAKETAA